MLLFHWFIAGPLSREGERGPYIIIPTLAIVRLSLSWKERCAVSAIVMRNWWLCGEGCGRCPTERERDTQRSSLLILYTYYTSTVQFSSTMGSMTFESHVSKKLLNNRSMQRNIIIFQWLTCLIVSHRETWTWAFLHHLYCEVWVVYTTLYYLAGRADQLTFPLGGSTLPKDPHKPPHTQGHNPRAYLNNLQGIPK